MRYCVKALGRGMLLQVLHLHAADAAQAERMARERGLSVVSVQAESRLAGWPRRANGLINPVSCACKISSPAARNNKPCKKRWATAATVGVPRATPG